MKISNKKLRQIIKEEIDAFLQGQEDYYNRQSDISDPEVDPRQADDLQAALAKLKGSGITMEELTMILDAMTKDNPLANDVLGAMDSQFGPQ